MNDFDPELAIKLYPDAVIVPIPAEPGFAHIMATTPDGHFQNVLDYHEACGSGKVFTQVVEDGSLRHVCRTCVMTSAVIQDSPEHREKHTPSPVSQTPGDEPQEP